MGEMNVGGEQVSYQRVTDSEKECQFVLVVTAESATPEATTHVMPLEVASEASLTQSLVADQLSTWNRSHPELSIHSWEVYERQPHVFGTSAATSEKRGRGENEWGKSSDRPVGEHTEQGIGEVSVAPGETIDFYPAGSSTSSVYGPRTGEVVEVAPGTDGDYCVVVETDSGTTKIRESWIIDDE